MTQRLQRDVLVLTGQDALQLARLGLSEVRARAAAQGDERSLATIAAINALAAEVALSATSERNFAQPAEPLDAWLTTTQVALLAGKTPQAVRKAIAAGRLEVEPDVLPYRIPEAQARIWAGVRAAA